MFMGGLKRSSLVKTVTRQKKAENNKKSSNKNGNKTHLNTFFKIDKLSRISISINISDRINF